MKLASELDVRWNNKADIEKTNSLKKAQNDAASLTAESVAANLAPEEVQRLASVRNIGIAVRNHLCC